MEDSTGSYDNKRSAGRDGLAALAIALLALALIIFVVSSLIRGTS